MLMKAFMQKGYKGKELCELNKCQLYLPCPTMETSTAQMLHTQLAVYGSETTTGNLVCTTQPPSQIQFRQFSLVFQFSNSVW
jgi:hypothetical protein